MIDKREQADAGQPGEKPELGASGETPAPINYAAPPERPSPRFHVEPAGWVMLVVWALLLLIGLASGL